MFATFFLWDEINHNKNLQFLVLFRIAVEVHDTSVIQMHVCHATTCSIRFSPVRSVESLRQHHYADNESSHKPVHQWLQRTETSFHKERVHAFVQRWETADKTVECTEKLLFRSTMP